MHKAGKNSLLWPAVPAYTYYSTALGVVNVGTRPEMAGVTEDFTIDPEKLKNAVAPCSLDPLGLMDFLCGN